MKRIELWIAAALLLFAIAGGVTFCSQINGTYTSMEERTNAKPF